MRGKSRGNMNELGDIREREREARKPVEISAARDKLHMSSRARGGKVKHHDYRTCCGEYKFNNIASLHQRNNNEGLKFALLAHDSKQL